MEMIAHGGKKRGGKGPSVRVAKDFVQADKGKKFKGPSQAKQDDEPGTVISEADYRPSKKKRGKIRAR